MSVQEALILGAVQGLTEFLPISSSGHLVLVEAMMKLPVESLKGFDIATHVGTLLALLIYFWRDFEGLIRAFFATIGQVFTKLTGRARRAVGSQHASESARAGNVLSAELQSSQKLMIYLVLATIPAIILGVTLGDWLDEMFRHPASVAIFMIVVGVLFFVAEWVHSRVKARGVGLREGLLMGLALCLALMPGVSRSGITISAGLVQGVKRDEAARFSFLLGTIAIFGAAVFGAVAIMKGKYALPATDTLIAGITSSFVVGLAAISFLMRFLKKYSLHIFGVYRVILGLVILYFYAKA